VVVAAVAALMMVIAAEVAGYVFLPA